MKQFESWQSDQFAGKKFVAKNERVSEAVWWKSSGKWSFPWEKGQLMEELVVPDAKLLKENIKGVNEFVKEQRRDTNFISSCTGCI